MHSKSRRAERRTEAQARQLACDALSPQDRLAKLDSEGHNAARERKRLARRIEIHRNSGKKGKGGQKAGE